jgi:hypothetical protein
VQRYRSEERLSFFHFILLPLVAEETFAHTKVDCVPVVPPPPLLQWARERKSERARERESE